LYNPFGSTCHPLPVAPTARLASPRRVPSGAPYHSESHDWSAIMNFQLRATAYSTILACSCRIAVAFMSITPELSEPRARKLVVTCAPKTSPPEAKVCRALRPPRAPPRTPLPPAARRRPPRAPPPPAAATAPPDI
jgi:hypothetical protein